MKNYRLLSTFTFFITSILVLSLMEGSLAVSSGKPQLSYFGARTIGTAGAHGAIVDDASSIFWNPAGLANINGETSMTENLQSEANKAFSDENLKKLLDEYSGEVKDAPPPEVKRSFEAQLYTSYSMETFDKNTMAVAMGFTLFNGTLGLGVARSSVTGIYGYDNLANPTGNLDYSFSTANLAYAVDAKSYRFGIGLNGRQEVLGNQNLYGGGLNAGAQVTPIPIISLGFSMLNLAGVDQTPDGKYNKADTIVDLSLAFISPPPRSTIRVMAGYRTNLDDRNNSSAEKKLGVIYNITSNLYVMVGLNNGNGAAGAGLSFKHFSLSYAINRDRLQTGIQQYLDLNLIF